MHGTEIGEVDGEGSAQMCRYPWHGHGTSVHEGSPEEWGKATEQAIAIKMKLLHWHNLYKPMHWHESTKAKNEHILESHIFVEENKMARSRPGRWYEETSSKTTSPKKMSAPPQSQLKK